MPRCQPLPSRRRRPRRLLDGPRHDRDRWIEGDQHHASEHRPHRHRFHQRDPGPRRHQSTCRQGLVSADHHVPRQVHSWHRLFRQMCDLLIADVRDDRDPGQVPRAYRFTASQRMVSPHGADHRSLEQHLHLNIALVRRCGHDAEINPSFCHHVHDVTRQRGGVHPHPHARPLCPQPRHRLRHHAGCQRRRSRDRQEPILRIPQVTRVARVQQLGQGEIMHGTGCGDWLVMCCPAAASLRSISHHIL